MVSRDDRYRVREVWDSMDAMVIGATFVGSIATAFVVQKAVLGAMLRAFERGKTTPR